MIDEQTQQQQQITVIREDELDTPSNIFTPIPTIYKTRALIYLVITLFAIFIDFIVYAVKVFESWH